MGQNERDNMADRIVSEAIKKIDEDIAREMMSSYRANCKELYDKMLKDLIDDIDKEYFYWLKEWNNT